MDEIKMLLEERAKIIVEAQAIMKKETVSKEDENKFHSLMDIADGLNTKAQNVKKLRDVEKSQKELGDIREDRSISVETKTEAELKAARNPHNIRATKEYAKLYFEAMATPKDLWRPEVRAALSTTPGADGGFLIPTEYEKQIVAKREQFNVMRQICRIIQTKSTRLIPVEAARQNAFWTAENAPFTESNPTFGQKSIGAFKAANLQKMSTEFLQDEDTDFYAWMADANGRAFGILEETAYVAGTGTTQPIGLLNAASGLTSVPTAAPTAITVDDLFNIYYGLPVQYRTRATFLMNDAIAKAIRMLKDPTTGIYYLQPNLAMPGPDTLFGKPVYISPAMPATLVANSKSIVFGEFYYALIADREGMTSERLNEVFRTNGQIGFITEERTDFLVTLPDAFKVLQQAP